ncbi:hypothetical protein D3C71_1220050 [compost metagenome]
MAAHLAQLEQRIEDGDLRLGQPLGLQGFAHGFFHTQADGFVQIGLRAGQFHGHHRLDLGRQLARHQGLGPAQHKRRDARAQLRHARAVALLFDGRAKHLLEACLTAQKTWHQKVKQAPDLAQVVFHGRARQAQPVARLQLADHLRGMRAGVLDVLRFIQHHQVPLVRQPALAVALQQRIRGNDQVMLGDCICHAVSAGAMQHQTTQPRAKAGRLALPVAHEAHGCDDQRRCGQPPRVFFDLDVCQGLQRLAQAHVVGQHPGQSVGTQKLQPVQPLLLVRPQGGPHAGGQRHLRQGADALQLGHHGAQGIGALPHRALAQRCAGAQRVHARELEAVAAEVVRAVAHQVQQGGHPGAQRVGRHPHKTRCTHTPQVSKRRQLRLSSDGVGRLLGGSGDQQGQQRQDVVAHAVDFHAQRQRKPGRCGLIFATGLQ